VCYFTLGLLQAVLVKKVESYYAHFPDCMIVRFYYLFIALITTLLNLLPAMGCRVDVAAGLNTQ